jgi:hypothetical protein
MRLTPDFERTLKAYVLGSLDEDLRVELEELLVTDPDAFEALGVIEDELVEEYLDGAGSPSERRSFEERCLASPEWQSRLSLARALRDRARTPVGLPREEMPPAQAAPARSAGLAPAWVETLVGWLRPARWQPAWVAAAAVLVVSLAGNAWMILRLDTAEPAAGPPLARPATAPPSADIEALAEEARDLRARLEEEQRQRSRPEDAAMVRRPGRAPGASIATFALASGIRLRSGGSLSAVAVPPDALLVRLRLELSGGGFPIYRASLHDGDGDEVWMASKLRPDTERGQVAVVLVLPSELLRRGDYQVKLSGIPERGEPEPVATYAFRASGR